MELRECARRIRDVLESLVRADDVERFGRERQAHRISHGELESRFDYVIVDTGPVLFVSDTLQLARSADAVVLSVLVGMSQVGNVSETASRLRAVGAKLTGVVVNGVHNVGHNYGYGY